MATNKLNELGFQEYLPVASGIVSGQPCQVGNLTGVALFDRDSAGKSTVDFQGAYNLSVKGVNDAGNVAVAAGDPLYFISTDTPVLSKKASGTLFGFALGAVTSGATATIGVLLVGRNNAPGGADVAGKTLRASIFVSTVATGTGSAQNIAHGLGVIPTFVMAAPVDLTPATVGSYVATYGSHTSTNVVITVTTSKTFQVIAIA